MQKKNEIVDEIRSYFSFERIRIVAICSLFGFVAGTALATYYVKFTPLIFLGSGILKTSMISIEKKEFFPAEDAGTLIIFSDRYILNNTDCELSISHGSKNSLVTTTILDKKSSVIRVEGRGSDPQNLKNCISNYINQLLSYDQKAASKFKAFETSPKPNNSNFIHENNQINIAEGGMIGEIIITKIPIRQYPINLFKLIFLFSLGGIFLGILICYCKAIFFDHT